MASTVTISPRGEQRVRGGHPWIYRADVVDVDAEGGDIVQVIGPRNRTIGHALFSDQSQVAIAAPAGILARNDPKVRALEGLGQSVEVLHGEVPESIVAREGPVEYEVDLRRGQKTGLFLDQRENREAAARYAQGRLLDCFSYHGGFAL